MGEYMKKIIFGLFQLFLFFLGKFFWRTTEKEMNIQILIKMKKQDLYTLKIVKKLFTGVGKTYYESGKLETIYRFKDGVLEGNGISYYESGKINSTFNYTKGNINGIAKSYYESGKIRTEKKFCRW